jgi:GNAT superfamily N-acetyltransferase
MKSDYFSLTTEGNEIMLFEGNDPYVMQHQELRSCLIGYTSELTQSAVLERMFIKPQDRKKGIARQMFDQFLNHCLIEGVSKVITMIVPDDPCDQFKTEMWVQRQGFRKNGDGIFILNIEP